VVNEVCPTGELEGLAIFKNCDKFLNITIEIRYEVLVFLFSDAQ
jgi:hypothetical protein